MVLWFEHRLNYLLFFCRLLDRFSFFFFLGFIGRWWWCWWGTGVGFSFSTNLSKSTFLGLTLNIRVVEGSALGFWLIFPKSKGKEQKCRSLRMVLRSTGEFGAILFNFHMATKCLQELSGAETRSPVWIFKLLQNE